MKSTVYLSDFRDAFYRAGRNTQFSYQALGLLFEYLEEVDPDYDLDVIALCCEYCENTPEDLAKFYDIDVEGLDDDAVLRVVLDWLYEATSVVGVVGDGQTIVYQGV
jgi:hypothetical protein